MIVLAIDPGTEVSGWCLWNSETFRPVSMGIYDHAQMREALYLHLRGECVDALVIEEFQSYGMPVGRDVLETIKHVGRFWQIADDLRDIDDLDVAFIKRPTVKAYLCNSTKAKDPNVNQAIRDKACEFHGISEKALKGRKADPGPFYGVRSHIWSAIALAITYTETQ